MSKYFNYQRAIELMNKGHVTSVMNGNYDYYIMKDGIIYGKYSCDDELFNVKSELKVIKNEEWYLIS